MYQSLAIQWQKQQIYPEFKYSDIIRTEWFLVITLASCCFASFALSSWLYLNCLQLALRLIEHSW